MPEQPQQSNRRSDQRQQQPPTVFYMKAIKPMDKWAKAGVRVAGATLFLLDIALFVKTHFLSPSHTDEHTVVGSVLEYTPFLIFLGLAVALFAQPEPTVRIFLKGIDAIVTRVPALADKFIGKDRRADK